MPMTNHEFDVLDELYFVTSFQVLKEHVSLSEPELKQTLGQLLEKQWVKCFKSASEELLSNEVNFERDYKHYFYLATKTGLLAHNSR